MNSVFLSNSARFIILVLLQALILSNINFLGYINPYLYILFIILLPVNLSQTKVIFFAFLLGLSVDFFQDSGGVHATACLVIAYLRPLLLRSTFGITYEHQTMKLKNTSMGERLQFIMTVVFIHHLVLFSMEFFNYSHFLLIAKHILFSGIFSTLLIFFTMLVFVRRKK